MASIAEKKNRERRLHCAKLILDQTDSKTGSELGPDVERFNGTVRRFR